MIEYDTKRKGFVTVDTPRTMMKGVCPLLKTRFYPSYDYIRAMSKSSASTTTTMNLSGEIRRSDTKEEVPILTGMLPQKESLEAKRESGMELGALIDKQLALYVTKQNHPRGDWWEGLHPRTKKIVKCIVSSLKWIPIASQVPVSSTKTRVATMVDLVCWDPTSSRYVVIETKSGFSGYYTKGTGENMLGVFGKSATDCPRDQHQLQLLANTALFMRTFRYSSTAHVISMVMVADDECVHLYPLQRWARDGLLALSGIIY